MTIATEEIVTEEPRMGEAVRNFRARYSLTQAELASLIGTTQVSVSRWETGETEIAHPVMLKLALAEVERQLKRKMPRIR